MYPESIWCGDCNGPHRVCELCGQLVSYDPVSKLTMDAHRSSHHFCLESESYAMRTRALAEHYARQERQMISDCLRCPDKLVFRYASDPTLYDDVAGQMVHNCDRPATPEPTPIRQASPPIKEAPEPVSIRRPRPKALD